MQQIDNIWKKLLDYILLLTQTMTQTLQVSATLLFRVPALTSLACLEKATKSLLIMFS